MVERQEGVAGSAAAGARAVGRAGRGPGPGLRIAITGSSGLIGSALIESFARDGHAITRVVRRRGGEGAPAGAVAWDPEAGRIDAAGLEDHDVVVHLAGETIAGVWTAAKRRRIRESRVRGTTVLCEALARLERPPRVLVAASAVGYYGDRAPAEAVDEESPPGTGFLAETVVAWEAASRPAEAAGIRVAHLRFGMVLSGRGGALAAMLPVFRAGLGGRLGGGRQIMSWIALSEVPRVVRHVVETESLAGPINVASPEPVTNAEFTTVLGRVLGRPTVLRVPAFAIRLALGQMGDELLLAGVRAVPRRLRESGYAFAHPDLEGALRHELVG